MHIGGRTRPVISGLHEVEKLRIVCNLDHGATNPSVIKELIHHGADVRMHKQVHAKTCYMDSLSFLGSSSMSKNGLSLPSSGEHEEVNMVFDGCYVNRHSTATHYQRPNMTHPQEGGTGGEVSVSDPKVLLIRTISC